MSASLPTQLAGGASLQRAAASVQNARRPRGSLVALVTPMHLNGEIDTESLKSLVDLQVSEGTDGIVVLGSTAEAATLTLDEHAEMLRLVIEHVRGRVPIIAGTGANSTQEAILLTDHARRLGADACLSVVPYYNKPTQEGIFLHFCAIAEAVDIPLIVYDVPGRTVVGMDLDTVARLSRIPVLWV